MKVKKNQEDENQKQILHNHGVLTHRPLLIDKTNKHRRKKDERIYRRFIREMELVQANIDRSTSLLHNELSKILLEAPNFLDVALLSEDKTPTVITISTGTELAVEETKNGARPTRMFSIFPCMKPPVISSFLQTPSAKSKESSTSIKSLTSDHSCLKVSNIILNQNHQTKGIQPPMEEDIVYPDGVIDRRPYQTVAQYRRLIGKSPNFIHEPMHIGENETETVVLGLEQFAQNHNCQLIFANEDNTFTNSISAAVQGTVDLGSIHLLATDALQRANFQLEMNIDLFDEFRKSKENVEIFITDFSRAIANILSCDPNYVSVSSIYHCMEKERKKYEIKLGLTAIDTDTTNQWAQDLQNRFREGFTSDSSVLRHVKPGAYDYKFEPVLRYLKIQPNDLEPMFNFDYRRSDLLTREKRGGYPYHFPYGWYRHSLKVADKYELDAKWLGLGESGDEWAVAYYGTNAGAVLDIVREGVRINHDKTDFLREKAVKKMGQKVNRSGICVTTHCDGGAYPTYSAPFSVLLPSGELKRFSLVFQCRVKSGEFTTHRKPVKKGKAWRFISPNHIRPYGILLKEEKKRDQ